VDDDDISIYMPEELDRLESLQIREFVHTHVYDVNLLMKGEMDVDLPPLFCAIGLLGSYLKHVISIFNTCMRGQPIGP
jgi:hypothetical protein